MTPFSEAGWAEWRGEVTAHLETLQEDVKDIKRAVSGHRTKIAIIGTMCALGGGGIGAALIRLLGG